MERIHEIGQEADLLMVSLLLDFIMLFPRWAVRYEPIQRLGWF